jgi:molecular chaperone GrpE
MSRVMNIAAGFARRAKVPPPTVWRGSVTSSPIPSALPKYSFGLRSGHRFYSTESQTETKPNEQTQRKAEQQEQPKEQAKEENTKQTTEEMVANFEKRLKDLEHKLEEEKQKRLYSYAETENVRRIAKEDVEKAKSFGIQEFAKRMLEVDDNLTRAIGAIKPSDLENNQPLSTLYEGIAMTSKELLRALTSFGLKKFEPVGDKFNPTLHSALFEIEDPKKTVGTVATCTKAGWTLKERVIRPAEVGVVKESK